MIDGSESLHASFQGLHLNETGGITCSEERLHSNQPKPRSGQTQ